MENNIPLINKIRRLAVSVSFLLLMIQGATAQNITRIEYYYDTDPGFGNGTAVSFTPAANISSHAFSASIAALSSGFHTLYVRSRDANDKWSLTANQSFVKYATPTGLATAGNVVKMEYFIDTDPGFGSATDVPVSAAPNISGMNFSVPLALVSSGFHTLYVRTKDADGKWSMTQNYPFIKYASPTGLAAAGNIVKMEYFVDTDPGFGSAIDVPVTPAANISGLVFNVSLASVSNGFHTLYVRTKDADGKWSITNNSSFVKYTSPTGLASAANIVKMEYFVDTDPGFGGATDVPVTPALDISGMIFSVPLASVSNGFHTLYVRTKDADGKWSITNNSSFVKYAAPTGLATAGNIVKMEFFVDTDPGFGNGGDIPFTHATNVVGLVANIDLTSVANGFHTMYIRSMDTAGKWSLTNYASFTGGQLQAPIANITVNGPSSFCLGAGTYLSANYSASATYQWKLNNVNINGATGITYVPTQSGSYTVVVTNAISSTTSSAVVITVNPIPTATISANGVLTFCQGGSVTLSVNATPNATYQWRINSINIFGETGTSYLATQSGIFDVAVTSTNGCTTLSAKDTVTVNPSPAAIISPSGNTTFCTGDSVILFANTGSGLSYTWTGGTTTSFLKVFSTGNYTVTVTNTGGCSTSASVAVSALTAPSATITPNGPTTFCNGNSVILSANTGSGLSYSWTGGAITSSITVTSSGTYSVTVSNAGCSRVSSPVTVTVNPGVTVSISAPKDTICQGLSDTLTASGATTYSWSGSGLNTNTGAVVIATPSSSTTYTVTGTTAGCIGTASFTVTINPNNTSVSTTTPTICSGSSAVLNASGAIIYAWSPSGTLSSPTGASVTATPLSQTTYTVTGTSGTCSTTASITINVNSTVVPSVTISTPQTTICAGTSVTFTASPVNAGASPVYQWFKNGVFQPGGTSILTSSSLANNDSVWTVMTSSAACPSPATATSNKVVMTVNPIVVPTIGIVVSQNPVCVGDSVTFTANITNGGASPVYQWKKNNVNVGSNSAIYKTLPANNDSVWCVLTSDALCATPASVTSSKIKMVVNQIAVPTVTVSPSQNPSCTGASITFSASPTSGGSTPAYQWFKNGNPVGTNSDSYTDNALADNDSVWSVMTSNATCASPLVVTSNKVIIVIAPQVVPSVIVSTPQTSVCAGASVTFTAAATNGGATPTFQWFKNGVIQAGNTSSFTNPVVNNDSVWTVMTSNATCPVPATATSNKVHMTVNATVTPTISVSGSPNPICAGDSVTFSASITNGGANPVYQWKKNNVNVGDGSSIYGTTTLNNNDSVWCVLTSDAPCPSPASVTSNKVHMTVNPIVTPTISVVASENPICTGASVTFTASITNGGSLPAFQWYHNGVTVGGNSAGYTFSGFASGDSVWCELTSNANCISTANAISNKVIITITPTVVPSVSISTPATAICAGASATFTASPTDGGTSPVYQWFINGILQAGNTGTFTNSGIADNDSVWTIMTSNAQCPSPATATSNKVVMTVNPIVVPSISVSASQNPVCDGDSVTFTATITNGGANPVYQWKRNNVDVGSGTDVFGTTALADGDSVWCELTSDALCASPVTVASSKIHMTVNSIAVPTISVSASANPACDGSTVTFTATITNGGTSPAYQWFKNTLPVGTNSPSYSDNTLADNDSVECVLASNAVCASISIVTSAPVIMAITPTVVPSVSVSASQTTICEGTSVDFAAAPVNGGASPFYQWFKNGVLQGSNTSSFSDASLADNDSVWTVMTSNEDCPVPGTALSNAVTVAVLPVSHFSFNQSICAGESFQFNTVSLTTDGTYSDTLTGSNGCDSIVTLRLTVNPVVTTNQSASICQGETYAFHGELLTANGTYHDTLTSVLGCDSFIVLNLQVKPIDTDSISAERCQGDPYNFHGVNLTASGVYKDTLTSSITGCDSIIVLSLTVHPLPVAVVTRPANDTLRTSVFVKYRWLRNNVALAGDTARFIKITQNGSYSVLVTDSFGCSDTSAALNVTNVGISETPFVNLMIYPNPTEGVLYVAADGMVEAGQIELRDDLGRLLVAKEIRNTLHEQVDLSSFSSGIYLLVIRNEQQVWITKRIFKE